MEQNVCKFNSALSGDLICDRFVYETNKAQAQKNVHLQYILGFVVKGVGTLFLEETAHSLTQGCMFFVPRNARYAIDGEEDLSYLYLRFEGRRADELVLRLGLDEARCVFDKTEHYARILDFGFDCLHKARADNLDIFGEAVLLYLLGHLENEAPAPGELIVRIVTVANERFSDPDFSLSALARELGYDAKYLSFLFKKKKGISFTRFLRDLRIKHALFLMEQGVVSVKNIAILSGFGDALYFSKIFKEHTGLPPKTYIENLQKEE